MERDQEVGEGGQEEMDGGDTSHFISDPRGVHRWDTGPASPLDGPGE